MINVILSENHVLVRKAIKSLLESESDIVVTGEADNFDQVFNLINNKVKADVVVAELPSPDTDVASFIKTLQSLSPNIKTAFLSTANDEKQIIQVMRAGAKGYLNQSINACELLFAVRHIHADGCYICSASSLALLNRLHQFPQTNGVKLNAHTEFSVREIQILTLMAEGFTNYEIADKLFTSKRTVENYRQNLLNKTGSRNTAALTKFAIQNQVIR